MHHRRALSVLAAVALSLGLATAAAPATAAVAPAAEEVQAKTAVNNGGLAMMQSANLLLKRSIVRAQAADDLVAKATRVGADTNKGKRYLRMADTIRVEASKLRSQAAADQKKAMEQHVAMINRLQAQGYTPVDGRAWKRAIAEYNRLIEVLA